jgi:protein-tyrosine phosphatase
VSGFVDLHCHWIAGIDDGAPSAAEGIAMLAALGAAGFGTVVATPHMRPGMFDNTRADLSAAFDRMAPAMDGAGSLPAVHLASEHYFDDKLRGILPVIAHPERYRCLWRSPQILEDMIDAGLATLLDAAAMVGKYGREPQRCAENLLERGLYHAACSDAHRAADVEAVVRGMRRIEALYGDEEVEFLFQSGPTELLSGNLPT